MGDRSLARALGAERCTTDPIYSKLPLVMGGNGHIDALPVRGGPTESMPWTTVRDVGGWRCSGDAAAAGVIPRAATCGREGR